MKILITGANGYIGSSIATAAFNFGHQVQAVTRYQSTLTRVGETIPIGSIDGNTNWQKVLQGCDSVIHCAARTHILSDKEKDPITEYLRINSSATLNLASQAVDAGVRRFIFISTVGVNGDETFNKPFTADDLPDPHSPYAVSKLEAENSLRILAHQTGLELVIIRPPMVYGPNSPGNFGVLMKWIKKGIPLPFGAVHNKRSFVALGNLVDLILNCLTHPNAKNQIFLVSDGEDLSTTDFLKHMNLSMKKQVILFPFPVSLLKTASKVFGRPSIAKSLFGSLQVDITKTSEILKWQPPLSVIEGLRRAVTQRT